MEGKFSHDVPLGIPQTLAFYMGKVYDNILNVRATFHIVLKLLTLSEHGSDKIITSDCLWKIPYLYNFPKKKLHKSSSVFNLPPDQKEETSPKNEWTATELTEALEPQ